MSNGVTPAVSPVSAGRSASVVRICRDSQDVMVTFLLIFLLTETWSLQTFLVLPSPQEVVRGESLELACLVSGLGGECRWEREGLPVGQYDEKYVWSGDREDGDCSLTILDSHPDYDSGLWSCQVSASNISAGDSLISPAVRVEVVTPPTQLYIQDSGTGLVLGDGEEITVKQGDYLALTCVAEGGRPAPALSWQSDLQQVQAGQLGQTSVELVTGDWVATAPLQVRLEGDWTGQEVSCLSLHPAGEARTTVRLTLLAPPVISHISLTGGQLLCHLEPAQEEPAVSWHRLDRPGLILSNSPVLELDPLTPEDLGDYVCVAENSVGRTEKQKRFSYEFPAVFGEVSRGPVRASLGSRLELECRVLASPPARLTWVVSRGGAEEEVGRADQLVIPVLEYGDSGLYRCKADNSVGPAGLTEIVSRDISVSVEGGPIVRPAGGQTRRLVSRGDNVELRADFCSEPASEVVWTDGEGNVLVQTEAQISSVEHQSGPCYTAKLLLLDVQTHHDGLYKLRLENDIGTAEQVFTLTLHNHFLNFEVLLAISGALILTIVLLVFVTVILCHKHSVRLSREETSSRETESETCSRDNSSEELLFNVKPHTGCSSDQNLRLAGRNYERFSNIYSFPNGGGSLRKSQEDRKVYQDSAYVHINTNSFSYVSYDDVDQHISNIL